MLTTFHHRMRKCRFHIGLFCKGALCPEAENINVVSFLQSDLVKHYSHLAVLEWGKSLGLPISFLVVLDQLLGVSGLHVG